MTDEHISSRVGSDAPNSRETSSCISQSWCVGPRTKLVSSSVSGVAQPSPLAGVSDDRPQAIQRPSYRPVHAGNPRPSYRPVHAGNQRPSYRPVHAGNQRPSHLAVHAGNQRPAHSAVHAGKKRPSYRTVHPGITRPSYRPVHAGDVRTFSEVLKGTPRLTPNVSPKFPPKQNRFQRSDGMFSWSPDHPVGNNNAVDKKGLSKTRYDPNQTGPSRNRRSPVGRNRIPNQGPDDFIWKERSGDFPTERYRGKSKSMQSNSHNLYPSQGDFDWKCPMKVLPTGSTINGSAGNDGSKKHHRCPESSKPKLTTVFPSRLSASHKDTSKDCRIGLWNCNSMNNSKFEYAIKFVSAKRNSLLAITELASENTLLAGWLSNHSQFPIISCPDNKRVGLMVPRFLHDCVEIVDSWQYREKRRVQSEISCQITTFRVTLPGNVLSISVVYLVPDASCAAKTVLVGKMGDLEKKLPNCVILGDFNLDFKTKKIKDFFKEHLDGNLSQVVDKTTRRSTRTVCGASKVTETVIDLVFLCESVKKKMVEKPSIMEDSPSDHFLVELKLDIMVPLKYRIVEYFVDKTRRPPIPHNKLPIITSELQAIFKQKWDVLENLTQVEIFEFVEKSVVAVLDKYNPLNKGGLLSKKVYAFTMSDATRRLSKLKNNAYNDYNTARRKNLPKTVVDELKTQYRVVRNASNVASRNEKKNTLLEL